MKLQKKIKTISKIMDENGLEELTVDDRYLFGFIKSRFHLTKANNNARVIPAPVIHMPETDSAAPVAPAVPVAPVVSGTIVSSPMVGVVYFAPDPDATPFIQVGKQVRAGDTLCLIEAMKTFSPVKAERDGVVAEIIAKDGQVVEFESPLIVIA